MTQALDTPPKLLQDNKQRFLFVSLATIITAFVLILSYYSVKHSEHKRLTEEANMHLSRLENSLNAMLEKHAYLPNILARNPLLRQFIQQEKHTAQEQEQLNRYLERVSSEAGTSDIYLMDIKGTTLASSNWHQDNSFIGDNYAYRPYFQEALQGKLGRYYALGARSQQRGYYFSTAIRDDESTIKGVIVVKIDITDFEVTLKKAFGDTQFMVTDEHGIIFMTSQHDWTLHALRPLSSDAQQQIQNSKQYKAVNPIPALKYVKSNKTPYFQVKNTHYLHTQKPMNITNWHGHILINTATINRTLFWVVALGLVIMSLLMLLIYLAWRFTEQRRHYERTARAELERQVRQRTQELEATQKELIQAAKMAALGQLASSINHELNNPLAAIRSYADNAQQFLQMQRTDMVDSNLSQIVSLTERMAAITRQLKSFSRKSQGNLTNCDLPHAIQSTLTILRHKLTDIDIHQHYAPNSQVKADLLWLEQILLNLLSNAIEAVSQASQPTIYLTTLIKDDHLVLHVQDNGTGINEKDLSHIFEAFYTTKDRNAGLGLGLSISARLTQDMHGTLSAANHIDGGAIFSLSLPLVEAYQDE